MLIGGLQKLTLIDYPGKIACTIFTIGCNFRCHYCHNPELVWPEKHPTAILPEQILEFLKERKKWLEGVCICGGEPLLQSDIIDFVREIKNLGFAVKIDTNGSQPAVMQELISKNLVDYWAMDIKAPIEKYESVIGVPFNQEAFQQSMHLLMKNDVDYELRTTVLPQFTDEDIQQIKKLATGAKKFILQPFIASQKDKHATKNSEKIV